MDPATLNLTTEILGYSKFCFVQLSAERVDAALLRALEVNAAGFENMHDVEGNPSDEARARGRYQYLRADPSLGSEWDIADRGISQANVLVRLEAKAADPLDAYERRLRSAVEPRGGAVYSHLGVTKPRSYTSYAMAQFAYAHALAPTTGAKHPFGVVTPQNKTQEWWTMDWMRRETFFLPSYDAHGAMTARGHALASAAGVPHINRRLVHHPEGYGLPGGYDFIGYFEFAEADAPVFRAVMQALRDRQQNPEWAYVREGPEWWGRRVRRVEELWG